MTKEEFEKLIRTLIMQDIIRKYIKNEINLTESQLRKVVKNEGIKRNNKRIKRIDKQSV